MLLKEFENLLEKYKSLSDKISELHDIGFDFYEGKFPLMSDVEKLFDIMISTHYNEKGVDWINWFIYETDYGQKDMEGRDENNKPICYDIKSLHEYIQKYHKK
jgi:hypothetical protein